METLVYKDQDLAQKSGIRMGNETSGGNYIAYNIGRGKGCEFMVKLDIIANFKHRVLEWDDTVVNMKYQGNLLVKPNVTKREMQEVVMQGAEPVLNRKDSDIGVKIIYSTYERVNIEKVISSATQLKPQERKLTIGLHSNFGDLFDDTLVKWDTEPVYLSKARIQSI